MYILQKRRQLGDSFFFFFFKEEVIVVAMTLRNHLAFFKSSAVRRGKKNVSASLKATMTRASVYFRGCEGEGAS